MKYRSFPDISTTSYHIISEGTHPYSESKYMKHHHLKNAPKYAWYTCLPFNLRHRPEHGISMISFTHTNCTKPVSLIINLCIHVLFKRKLIIIYK